MDSGRHYGKSFLAFPSLLRLQARVDEAESELLDVARQLHARIADVVAAGEASGVNGGKSRRGKTSSAPEGLHADAVPTQAFMDELKLQGFVTAGIPVGEGTQLVRFRLHAFGIWGWVGMVHVAVWSTAVHVHDGLHRHAVHVQMDCTPMQSMCTWTASVCSPL